MSNRSYVAGISAKEGTSALTEHLKTFGIHSNKLYHSENLKTLWDKLPVFMSLRLRTDQLWYTEIICYMYDRLFMLNIQFWLDANMYIIMVLHA